MKVWLLQPSEILPLNKNDRLLRTGLMGEELSKDKKNDVTWFTSSFDHFQKKQLVDKDTVIDVKDNYHLKLIYAKGYKKNISIARIINHKRIGIKLKKMFKNEEKPDIIFTAFPTVEFALEAVKYGKKNNVPVVVDVRDLWPDIFKHNLNGIIKYLAMQYVWFLNIKVKKILSNCYAITSVTDLALNWSLDKGKRKRTKIDRFFYLGYKVKDDKTKTVDNKIKKIIDKKKFNICFFATINNQFNYELIGKIGKSLENDNVNIIICGDGPNKKELENNIKDIDNIQLLGWCNNDTLSYVIENSKMGLAPYKDTFDFQMSVSNKFCEYLSHGLPVLLTCSGNMKNIIDKEHIGYAGTNIEEIRKFVLKIKNNKQKYKEMSKRAYELFKNNYDATTIYPNMVKYLEEVKEDYYK